MSIKVIQVNPIICPTPDIDTVNIISAARQERVCANMSPVTICIPQGVQGAQGTQGPQGIQGIQGPAGPQGIPGQGVPTGGTAGQVLAKIDGTDYNTEWVDQSGEVTYQESVTYAQLAAKIGASELEPGLQYLISDFRSSWYHLDGGTPINSPNYATVEPIVVTAITANKIASLAYSTVHPSDVLYYDWNADNWNTDNFYSIGGTIIPGWRGVITERIDTQRNNRATFNFRVMTFRRWGITAPAYNPGTTYNLGDVVKSGNFLFLCKRHNTTGIATSNAERWVPLFGGVNINTSKFWATSSSGIGFDIPDIDNEDVGFMQIPSDGTFQDFLSFSVENSRNMDIEGDNGSRSIAANFVSQSGVNIKSKALNCTLGSCSNVELHANVLNIYFPNCNGVIIKSESANIILGDGVSIEAKASNCVVGDFCGEIIISASYIFLGRNSFFVQIESGQSIDIAQAQGLVTGSAFSKNRAAIIQDSSFANGCERNTFAGLVNKCSFGNSYIGNTHTGDVTSSTFGDDNLDNTWPEMQRCTIGDSAQNNAQSVFFGIWTAVTAAAGFASNDLGALTRCTFGNDFSLNAGQFEDCNIADNFGRNTFNGIVKKLSGGAGFQNGDYTLGATIVYNNASKTFLLNESEDKLIQYIDASNAVVIASHDA